MLLVKNLELFAPVSGRLAIERIRHDEGAMRPGSTR
jgi:hypothetical protein